MHRLSIVLLLACTSNAAVPADEPSAALSRVDGRVYPADSDRTRELTSMLSRDLRARTQAANLRESRAWQELRSRADWERFRDPRLAALQASLGESVPPAPLKVQVTRQLQGDGYRIENLVYESRPGLLVTANLYLPAQPAASMPGIVLSHSHHNPKTQGELQDMGMTWARLGCVVLVPDHLGHGERRQHPFRSEKDYPRPFRAGRQDYYFRYNTALQLHLVGESLMGWMVHDLRRGIDLLLARPGVDPSRILLLGAVAGGGDPAGVTAALDPRIAAVVPFNFGGTQPDYATPADPERDFYWFGVPYWESTRCLRLGARDGFAHWVITGAVAPRRLVHAHEFAWDPKRDPAWPRLQQVFAWYGVPERLASAQGQGTLKGTPPESSHCNNIGALHRSRLYPLFERWFGMPIPSEYSQRRPAEELLCLTSEKSPELRFVAELTTALAEQRLAAARQRLGAVPAGERAGHLRRAWAGLLGDIEPRGTPQVLQRQTERLPSGTVEHLALEVEPGIVVPLLVLVPDRQGRAPVVLGVAQDGKQAFLKGRAEDLAALLKQGIAVCLPDVRGTGESRPGQGRGRGSAATSLSAAEWLLGQTLVGSRLRDLRAVVRYLRSRADLDTGQLALWGESLAPVNANDTPVAVPYDAEPQPHLAEPLGGLLALFGALYEPDVRGVLVRGGLVSYASVLASPFCHVPHDALVPGALQQGDLGDVIAGLAPRPVRLDTLVTGLNQPATAEAMQAALAPARTAYEALQAGKRLQTEDAARAPAAWLAEVLRVE